MNQGDSMFWDGLDSQAPVLTGEFLAFAVNQIDKSEGWPYYRCRPWMPAQKILVEE